MTDQPTLRGARRMAYLSAQHPMLSMIFIVREIAELEKLGFDIEIASINDGDRPRAQLTSVEAAQADKTYYVKSHGLGGAVAAHLHGLFTRPRRYLSGWRQALSLAGLDLRALAFHALYLTEALMVGRWMQRRRLRHLHVHLGSQPSTVGLLVKAVFDIGLSITVHGADEFYDAWRQHLPEKVAGADFIVCISDFARSQLMFVSDSRHWSRLVVCRLGIDVSMFAPRPSLRTRADAPFHLLCVGRLSPAKGQELLVEAVARLRGRGHAVSLDIVGAGVNEAVLRGLVQARGLTEAVTLSGPVNQDRIRDHYTRADCFAMASFAEGIPVVLMEAMSMQIPCVTTHITGIPELIAHGRTGLLAPPSNVEALVEQIERLITDPSLGPALGRAARLQVEQKFNLTTNAAHLAEIFVARVQDSPLSPAG
jgi:colanic acid/amylovoran biosynthesis glycosyltransferase